ncbi:MAG: hypothetical protein R3244_01790, partial [Thermoanaerobaculia bacterium]|nr:hypothetical protein [Thermoanaerobaculia bacterium]
MSYAPAAEETVVMAPLVAEIRPLLRRLAARRVEAIGPARLHRGRLDGRPLAAAVIGDGAARARAAIEAVLAGCRPRRVLLIGVAGGLSPDLPVGALVRVDTVVDLAGGEPRWVAGSAGEGEAVAVSVERIVGTAVEKAAVWERLGRPPRAVVDLESAAFVESASAAAARWTVLRAVSDGSDDDLPPEVPAAADRHGHVDPWRVLGAVARRPWRLGALLDL